MLCYPWYQKGIDNNYLSNVICLGKPNKSHGNYHKNNFFSMESTNVQICEWMSHLLFLPHLPNFILNCRTFVSFQGIGIFLKNIFSIWGDRFTRKFGKAPLPSFRAGIRACRRVLLFFAKCKPVLISIKLQRRRQKMRKRSRGCRRRRRRRRRTLSEMAALASDGCEGSFRITLHRRHSCLTLNASHKISPWRKWRVAFSMRKLLHL